MIYSTGRLYSLADMNISVSTVVCMVAIVVSMVVCMVAIIVSMVVMSVMSVIVYVGHCLLLADYRT
jgi:hypothetical protein